MEPPSKKQKKALLDDTSDSESSDEGGVKLNDELDFKINKEYARRFEYNKKREELQHLEEKLGKSTPFAKRQKFEKADENEEDDEDESEESSESETEDDAAELVTEAVDSEILATIQAIRNKDPRVYDKGAVFYTKLDDESTQQREKEHKPMYLRDYHRENILRGTKEDGNEDDEPKTYVQEQEHLKRSIVKEMHAAADADGENGDGGDSNSDDDGFLVRKSKPKAMAVESKKITEEDVATADKNPETFLSNFMASRAWIPSTRPNFQPFESDDDEEEAKAEAFEEAYNLRFEDPDKLNEALVTHARDTMAKFSVRRDELSGRKRKREAEKLKKEEEKKQRHEERARLRKLKIEQLEEKVTKIKKAAGLRAQNITDEEWAGFLDDGWDDSKWEEEMEKRFGETYYAEGDPNSDDDEAESSKKRRVKKPTWDDDIDINDIIPDFEDDEQRQFDISDPEVNLDEEANEASDKDQKSSKKKRLQEKKDKQKETKRERRKIETIVDKSLDLEPSLLPGASKKFSSAFRYRETSPISFGLTSHDILMADDSQLNQFAGLKKLAPFRAPDKKQRDYKKLGKKARVRQWRKDTFGDENGPQMTFAEPEPGPADAPDGDTEMKVDIHEGGRKKRRKRSKKQ
ncbi:Kinetochore protein Spc24 [Ophidiomyces ophidiicola]|nr:Kinetochore protein Spc24 [Ophidiomyces ophidiicola]KAI1962008.1 Kinetochore protein Spc24 [Ophidiomyces ophidiicola]